MADAEVAALDAQAFAHREEGVEHQLLRHDAERLARGGVVGHHVVAHHRDAAGAGARQAGQHRDQRRLAGAVGAEQAEELALLDVEGHAVERAHFAAGARIGLGNMVEHDGNGHGAAIVGSSAAGYWPPRYPPHMPLHRPHPAAHHRGDAGLRGQLAAVPAGAAAGEHRPGQLRQRAPGFGRAGAVGHRAPARGPAGRGAHRLAGRHDAVGLRGLLLVRLPHAGGRHRRADPVRRRAGDDVQRGPARRRALHCHGLGRARAGRGRPGVPGVARRGRADAAGRGADGRRRHRLGHLLAARPRRGRAGGSHGRQLPARRATGAGPERGIRRQLPGQRAKAWRWPSHRGR